MTSTAKTEPKAKTPMLRGQTRERAPVSQSTLEDALYVAVSPTSPCDVAWAALGREWELENQGYVTVHPDELERLVGGTYTPHEKHFGVRFFYDKSESTVIYGQHRLMKVGKEDRQDRIAEEARRMQAFKPKRNDKAEKANLEEEGYVTIAEELKGK